MSRREASRTSSDHIIGEDFEASLSPYVFARAPTSVFRSARVGLRMMAEGSDPAEQRIDGFADEGLAQLRPELVEPYHREVPERPRRGGS